MVTGVSRDWTDDSGGRSVVPVTPRSDSVTTA